MFTLSLNKCNGRDRGHMTTVVPTVSVHEQKTVWQLKRYVMTKVTWPCS